MFCKIVVLDDGAVHLLLYDESAVGLDGHLEQSLLVHLFLREAAFGPFLVLFLGHVIIYLHRLSGEHGQVEGELLGGGLGIQSGDDPAVAAPSCHDYEFARVTVNQSALVPGGGHAAQEVEFHLRQLLQVVSILTGF